MSDSSSSSSSSSSIPCPVIVGPQTLVSTVDSPGLNVTYTAEGFPEGGSYSWSIEEKNQRPLSIELVSASGASATVRAIANAPYSIEERDQLLKVRWTKAGDPPQVIERQLGITVVKPVYAAVVNGGKTAVFPDYLSRTLRYQLIDHLERYLREVYTYTNALGQLQSRRVVNLLVSEQLNVTEKSPPGSPESHSCRKCRSR